MRSTRKFLATTAVGASLLGGMLLSSCSTTISNDDFKKELVSAGMAEKDAQCIIDDMKAKGVEVKKYADMSADETKVITDAATSCAFKSLGMDPNSVSIPSIPDVSTP